MYPFLCRHWFLLSLVFALVIGIINSGSLEPIAQSSLLRSGILVSVLYVMSLPMETRTMWRTITHPWAAVLASVMNMGVLPVIAWAFSNLLVEDMSVGLIIASVVPCTLASAAVWTRRAGGNDAAAILVTILTNMTCFLVTPSWLMFLLGKSVQFQPKDRDRMMYELAVLVVLPIVAGQFSRCYSRIALWSTRNKRPLSNLAQIGILGMVFIGAIQCGLRLNASEWKREGSVAMFVTMAISVLSVHLLALHVGKAVAFLLGMNCPDQIAVAFAGSQKTLMVGVYIAVNFFGGLTILPMVAYHVGQLVVDTILADRWRKISDRDWKSLERGMGQRHIRVTDDLTR
jgi:sodium/bile acid cotransporter 7